MFYSISNILSMIIDMYSMLPFKYKMQGGEESCSVSLSTSIPLLILEKRVFTMSNLKVVRKIGGQGSSSKTMLTFNLPNILIKNVVSISEFTCIFNEQDQSIKSSNNSLTNTYSIRKSKINSNGLLNIHFVCSRFQRLCFPPYSPNSEQLGKVNVFLRRLWKPIRPSIFKWHFKETNKRNSLSQTSLSSNSCFLPTSPHPF